ncbi:L-gulonolactone oxidase [Virgisporangium aliadipatigenens]|uniref:L-gulonolactone oxidase n=1 Tax=Virgisporangium aliadipatigenens TaxID=741659 RepID=A0A8J4DSM9_9ACTN|nr:D-arabinono-1,4-lactone oxidase [Virgisporangium aliadipatigenens]GIJ47397.1 L-gulonolactone oxidase [Virgisporangium aliadipatigenens]
MGVSLVERSWHNWTGNVGDAAPVAVPESVSDLVSVVREAASQGRRVRVAGSGHSFSEIARADGVRVSLSRLDVPVHISGTSVTVPAGMTLRALNALLAANGLALPNLGDIDAQTVAGAVQTGTHGTGAAYGCLSTFVTAMSVVTGDGREVTWDRENTPRELAAAAVGLGGFGAIVSVTLECVPAFVLRAVEKPQPLTSILPALPELIAAHDHTEFFWFPHTSMGQLKINDRVATDDAPLASWRRWLDDEFLSNSLYGVVLRVARRAPVTAPPLMKVAARALTARTYTAASYDVFCTPRRVRFTEMEYSVPREALPEAFAALRGIVDRLPFRIAFPVEVRFTAADQLWMSHGYGRDNAYIAAQQFVGMPYRQYFDEFEKVCLDLGGRPHWGKMHYADPARLRAAYPRWDEWVAMRDAADPDGVFRSPFLDRMLG